ncbi:hypothetical protein ACFCYM_35315, partial [Streptomyces sp. NPDC056254]|uniref:hypothetical protein n=1 Tax=Streptomyces sp. NPDC056254 TaxID=3345763 RepID=UPI0035E2771B
RLLLPHALHDEHHPSRAETPDLRCPSKRIKPTSMATTSAVWDPTARTDRASDHVPVFEVPMQEKDVDQLFGALGVAFGGLGRSPE